MTIMIHNDTTTAPADDKALSSVPASPPLAPASTDSAPPPDDPPSPPADPTAPPADQSSPPAETTSTQPEPTADASAQPPPVSAEAATTQSADSNQSPSIADPVHSAPAETSDPPSPTYTAAPVDTDPVESSGASAAQPSGQTAPAQPLSSNAAGRTRRTRPRRRVADSDSEGEDRGEDSLTEHSSDSEEGSEEDADVDADERAVEAAVDVESPAAPVFANAASTTPAAWNDSTQPAEEVSFEDFERGVAPAVGGKAVGRGAAATSATDRPKKVYTEAETKRFEERKAKMKERQKAKRAELKEQKRKEREAANGVKPESSVPADSPKELSIKGKAAKSKLKKRVDESTLVASTSALKIGDAAPDSEPPQPSSRPAANSQTEHPDALPSAAPSGPRSHNQASREAYTEQVANDPKFTPRVGGFWTHDQRHYDAGKVGEGGYTGLRNMSEYWRGRGGPRGGPRGGFKGRGGRGFGPQGFGQHPLGQRTELTAPEEETGGSKLAMDREIELEEARRAARRRAAEEAQAQAEAEQAELEAQDDFVEPAVAPAPAPSAERKWGHEAYESIQAVEHFQMNRGRGRGRGRAAFFPRGGFVPRGNAPRPFSPHASAPPFVPSGPAAKPEQAGSPSPAPAETSVTQPTVDELLPEAEHLVKVKLPGSEAASQTAVLPKPQNTGVTIPSSDAVAYRTSGRPLADDAEPPVQLAAPSSNGHDAIARTNGSGSVPPVNGYIAEMAQASTQYPSITGSENGSISSAGHMPPQAYLPPGIGVTPTGEYFNVANGAPVNFRPAQAPAQSTRPYYPRAYPSQQPPQFYPQQSYSPDPFNPTHPHRASISSNGPGPMQSPQGVYMNDGRGSPFSNPYSGASMTMGVPFVPARSSMKVTIRKPDASASATALELEKAGAGTDARPGAVAAAGLNGEARTTSAYAATLEDAAAQQRYFAQHYNPYAAFDEHQQQGMQGQEGMYYPNGYGWPAGQQVYGEAGAGYGYQAPYPGF